MPHPKHQRKESDNPAERCWNTVPHERKIELRRLAAERLANTTPPPTVGKLTDMTVPVELHGWLKAEATLHDLTIRGVVVECIRCSAEGRPYAPVRGFTPAEKKYLELELRRQKKFAAAAAAKTREKNDSNIP